MESTNEVKLEGVKARLIAEGYGGLYCEGDCACGLDALAHCGELSQDEDEEWINGCEAAYRHEDPKRSGVWVISLEKEPPSQETFDKLHE